MLDAFSVRNISEANLIDLVTLQIKHDDIDHITPILLKEESVFLRSFISHNYFEFW